MRVSDRGGRQRGKESRKKRVGGKSKWSGGEWGKKKCESDRQGRVGQRGREMRVRERGREK